LAYLHSLNEIAQGREGLEIDYPDFGQIYSDLIGYSQLQKDAIDEYREQSKRDAKQEWDEDE